MNDNNSSKKRKFDKYNTDTNHNKAERKKRKLSSTINTLINSNKSLKTQNRQFNEANSKLQKQNNILIKQRDHYKHGVNIYKKEAQKWQEQYNKLYSQIHCITNSNSNKNAPTIIQPTINHPVSVSPTTVDTRNNQNRNGNMAQQIHVASMPETIQPMPMPMAIPPLTIPYTYNANINTTIANTKGYELSPDQSNITSNDYRILSSTVYIAVRDDLQIDIDILRQEASKFAPVLDIIPQPNEPPYKDAFIKFFSRRFAENAKYGLQILVDNKYLDLQKLSWGKPSYVHTFDFNSGVGYVAI